MRILSSKDSGFSAALDEVLNRGSVDASSVEEAVKAILKDVKARGDSAVCDYTGRFDRVDVRGRLAVKDSEINAAFKEIPKTDLKMLELAASRIEAFHKRQRQKSWMFSDKYGTRLGVKVSPIERAGIYVPGGKAAYPSTVLMNAIPARVAGVGEVVMATPPSAAGINPYVLASAKIAGVGRVFRAGGAQAIGALAYGTESVPKADKITGPGNIYVATAKRLVYGTVDIDMIAGPSEILVINDGTGEASWIAADLLSQAEHDELASSILITTSGKMALSVKREVDEGVKRLVRARIAEASVSRYGLIIVVESLEEASEISNRIAPEHLELFVKRPRSLLRLIRNAGAVFMGALTPEAAGDYLAGPNHTLPTGGTARFSSPLGVEDFIKRTSIISFSKKGIEKLGPAIARFAALEGLEGHGRSLKARLQ